MEPEGLYKRPPPVPILSQVNPIHKPETDFPKICFNIILSPVPRFAEWSLPFRFSN
jgi:hypothetical protein